MKANKTKPRIRIVHLNLYSQLKILERGIGNTHPVRGSSELAMRGKIVPPMEAPAATTPNAKFLRR